MWPGGEVPVCSPGQQETRVWRGDRESGHEGGRAALRSVPLATGTGEQGAGAGAECGERLCRAGERER